MPSSNTWASWPCYQTPQAQPSHWFLQFGPPIDQVDGVERMSTARARKPCYKLTTIPEFHLHQSLAMGYPPTYLPSNHSLTILFVASLHTTLNTTAMSSMRLRPPSKPSTDPSRFRPKFVKIQLPCLGWRSGGSSRSSSGIQLVVKRTYAGPIFPSIWRAHADVGSQYK